MPSSLDLAPERPGDVDGLVPVIEGWTVLEGWFGDAGSLEVWMRQSDLDAGAFEGEPATDRWKLFMPYVSGLFSG